MLERLKQTCIQIPPVDAAEEGMIPELVTRAVLEAEPFVDLSDQQPLADGAGLLAELLRVCYWIIQDPLLQHLILHLQNKFQTFICVFAL